MNVLSQIKTSGGVFVVNGVTYFTARFIANKIGVHYKTLVYHKAKGHLPEPNVFDVNGVTVHGWVSDDMKKIGNFIHSKQWKRRNKKKRRKEANGNS